MAIKRPVDIKNKALGVLLMENYTGLNFLCKLALRPLANLLNLIK